MIVCHSAAPASSPLPRLRARSMLSCGTEFLRAFCMASYSVGLASGSPPPVRAATSTFLISFANSLPRLASTAAFLCLVVAHLEWPLMSPPSTRKPAPVPPPVVGVAVRTREPSARKGGAPDRHPSAPDGTRWRAQGPAELRRSYRRPPPP